MDDFHQFMSTKYDIKRLGRPSRYLGWHFHYHGDGTIALIQRLLIDKTLTDERMLHINGKHTPYLTDEYYHPPDPDDTLQPDTERL